MTENTELFEQTKSNYLNAILSGNSSAATQAIDSGLALGISPSKIYCKVLMPAQLDLGEHWHAGKISISEEHLATQITLSEMSRLRHLFKPKCSLGLKAVIATVDGDSHFIGGRVVGDFLHMDGWDVDFLGTNTPTDDLIKFISSREVNLVGLSITMEQLIPEVKKIISALKKLPKAPKILLGGPAMHNSSDTLRESLGADAVATDAKDAVEKARKICGLTGTQATLNQYLKGLGARILETRKARKFSQQELANGSGLDRAYISSVENGKQNVTVGAVLKLAEAMDVTMEELLVGGKTTKGF